MSGRKLTPLLLTAVLLLGGCASAPTKYKLVCPQLDPPTTKAVDALADAAEADKPTADWTVKLEKHYEKLERCK